MKRRLCLLLAIALIAVLLVPAGAFAARDLTAQESLAKELDTLNMLEGDAPGQYALGRAMNRLEAVVMVIRMLGLEKEATRVHWANTFLDLTGDYEWADTYIGFAKKEGIVDGVSPTEFGVGPCTPQMYLTFTLRALGYDDITGNDFVWDKPETLAREVGILTDKVSLTETNSAGQPVFLRADMVTVCTNALSAKLKGSEKTLAESLIGKGVFTTAAYDATSFGKGKLQVETVAKDGFYQDYPWLPDLGDALGIPLTERKTYNDGYQYRYRFTDYIGKDQAISIVQEYYRNLTDYGITPTNFTPGSSYTSFYTDYTITIYVTSEYVYIDVMDKYST
jgi:hypothetical protein